jgi:hypothetical protein
MELEVYPPLLQRHGICIGLGISISILQIALYKIAYQYILSSYDHWKHSYLVYHITERIYLPQ